MNDSLSRFCLLTATSGLMLIGLTWPSLARLQQADESIIVVATSYRGDNAERIADTVAAQIEIQIDGVEGLVRMESISSNDGKYTARLYFDARTDFATAMKVVKNRMALAEPALPDLVRKH